MEETNLGVHVDEIKVGSERIVVKLWVLWFQGANTSGSTAKPLLTILEPFDQVKDV